ncbi:BlaI/MecI/CopY family transcriptional regulator [Nocardioides anomalus]|uniref:BlaI/MecI/CopY family transcriptional regulator n=1 Tax=Nocardioides anomalus TaxID=2712223 RepID=A0A6G6WAS8_9ACTN|nr:BlaI/MecI/CopY family transcriptional regulator [Nocardioides anomalus]QIG42253.1 BlaI/MecI/CopY family transcriptional regulator [Nocardioides anomalus]
MPLRSLGELERSVMEQLWAAPADPAHDGLTVREVHAALAEERDIAYTTVMTVMDRLARKELVAQERDGRAYRYRARASRAEMTADLMRETLADFDAHDRRSALAAFVDTASAADVAALRAALDQLD